MASLSDRIRNVFRNEMVIPAPEKTTQEIEMDNERMQAKINEGFKMGVSETIRELSEYATTQDSVLATYWANDLANSSVYGSELTPQQIDQNYTNRIKDLNELIGGLREQAAEHGVTPEHLAEEVPIPEVTHTVHAWARELADERGTTLSEFRREQAGDAQLSRDMETSGKRYEYLNVAIEHLTQAGQATNTREVAQAWTVSQPQQAVFIQPQRVQQVAVESPEVQQDFEISF